ncbi:MAG TPA: peptidylprolyl isomerase [Steroidobacteraceae bacterium]|jgi:peptidyl-prolyl cis-trans isomerase SurA|nr:peptidylprolyl isomerase [Steroidobacteraceae bacterium]
MIRKVFSRGLLVLAATFFAQAALAQTREASSSGVLLDRIAATVNEGVVLQSELDEQMIIVTQRLREQRLELPPQNVLRKQVLDRLVLQELQMQRADRAGIKVSDEILNNALNDVATQNKIKLTDLPDALEAQGIDYAGYRDSLRKELAMQILRQRDVIARINVSPREIDQFLERQKKMPSDSTEYDISHILIAVPQAATPEQLDEAAKKADEVYQKATSGEDFARLAVQYSNAQTALEGGKLGVRKGSELPTFLTDVIAGMKVGDVTKPLRTPSGFHIVKLNEMHGGQQVISNQVHARHILIKPNELQDDATVQQKLESIRDRILNKGENFAAVASVVSEDPGSAANGGDLGWTDPGTFVPEFEKQLAQLQPDEISQPFRTQFGWHIIQLLGRRQHDTTQEMLRQQAFARIREGKADEETELWLRRLRDEAYVEYKL